MRKLETVNAWLARKLKDPQFRNGYRRELTAARLAVQIAQVRQTRGLTQEALARRMGTSQQAVARLERGDHDGMSVRTLGRLAEALDAELVIQMQPRLKRRRKSG